MRHNSITSARATGCAWRPAPPARPAGDRVSCKMSCRTPQPDAGHLAHPSAGPSPTPSSRPRVASPPPTGRIGWQASACRAPVAASVTCVSSPATEASRGSSICTEATTLRKPTKAEDDDLRRHEAELNRRLPPGSRWHQYWCGIFRGKRCDCDEGDPRRAPRPAQYRAVAAPVPTASWRKPEVPGFHWLLTIRQSRHLTNARNSRKIDATGPAKLLTLSALRHRRSKNIGVKRLAMQSALGNCFSKPSDK